MHEDVRKQQHVKRGCHLLPPDYKSSALTTRPGHTTLTLRHHKMFNTVRMKAELLFSERFKKHQGIVIKLQSIIEGKPVL